MMMRIICWLSPAFFAIAFAGCGEQQGTETPPVTNTEKATEQATQTTNNTEEESSTRRIVKEEIVEEVLDEEEADVEAEELTAMEKEESEPTPEE